VYTILLSLDKHMHVEHLRATNASRCGGISSDVGMFSGGLNCSSHLWMKASYTWVTANKQTVYGSVS